MARVRLDPWVYGLVLGLCVGGGVVLVSSIRFGFSAELLLIGLVLAVAFGSLGLMGAIAGRKTHVD
jgi:hypothetical protein